MNTKFLSAAVAALAIGALAPQAHAVITFDPDGAGGASGFTFTGFDWAPGNALAVGTGGIPVAGQSFDLFYQAQLKGFDGSPAGVSVDSNTGEVTVGGTDTGVMFTIVAGFREVVTQVIDLPGPTGFEQILVFDVLPNQGPNYLQVYAKTAGSADNRAGSGFGSDSPGTLILDAEILAQGYSSNFQVNGTGDFTSGGVAGIDSGIDSVTGNGSTNLQARVNSFDANYFSFGLAQALIDLSFQTTQSLPFANVPPSLAFYDGDGTLRPRDIGTFNGTGNDVQFQADASNTFIVAAVPEPGTISVALCGIGLVGLGALRKRFRREV